jgi:hypothetical protein
MQAGRQRRAEAGSAQACGDRCASGCQATVRAGLHSQIVNCQMCGGQVRLSTDGGIMACASSSGISAGICSRLALVWLVGARERALESLGRLILPLVTFLAVGTSSQSQRPVRICGLSIADTCSRLTLLAA